jgi:hypothetical protein
VGEMQSWKYIAAGVCLREIKRWFAIDMGRHALPLVHRAWRHDENYGEGGTARWWKEKEMVLKTDEQWARERHALWVRDTEIWPNDDEVKDMNQTLFFSKQSAIAS